MKPQTVTHKHLQQIHKDLSTAISTGESEIHLDSAVRFIGNLSDAEVGGLAVDLRNSFGDLLVSAALSELAQLDDDKLTILTKKCVVFPVYTSVLQIVSDTLRDRFAEDNLALRQDLETLWSDNHLGQAHEVMLATCNHDPDNPDTALVVRKNGEQYDANPKLKSALQRLHDKYTFDELECWPCRAECGGVLFYRTVYGVVVDAVTDEEGEMTDGLTCGVIPAKLAGQKSGYVN